MKKLILTIAITILSMSTAHATEVSVSVYLFTGTLEQINKFLEFELKEKAKTICPNSNSITVTNLMLELKSGPHGPNIELKGTLNLNDINSSINFQAHPYATMTSEIQCN